MSLKRHITNTQAAITAWSTVDPGTVSPGLRSYREESYPLTVTGPPSCGSPACFAGHLPYFPHFAGMGVRASKYGVPFLKRLSNLTNQALSECLFGDQYLFDVQRPSERGTAHEVVAARLRDNLERLLELERSEDNQPTNLK